MVFRSQDVCERDDGLLQGSPVARRSHPVGKQPLLQVSVRFTHAGVSCCRMRQTHQSECRPQNQPAEAQAARPLKGAGARLSPRQLRGGRRGDGERGLVRTGLQLRVRTDGGHDESAGEQRYTPDL